MKKLICLLMLAAGVGGQAALACAPGERQSAAVKDLSVGTAALKVSGAEGRQSVLTLGTLVNASASCLDNLVVEVRYFDDKGALIDTTSTELWGVIVPAQGEAAFKVRSNAVNDKAAYATQKIRVMSAEARPGRSVKPNETAMDTAQQIFISWFPMVLLIGVWIYFAKRMKSPQDKLHQLVEEQNKHLARIATALERKD